MSLNVCFIPIKENSERLPGKNFRLLNGRKLYEYILDATIQSECFDEIFVDTNSAEVSAHALRLGMKVIPRAENLAGNSANGNDLLNHHRELYPHFDFYFQAFATAPFLQPQTIRECVDALANSRVFDSCFTALRHQGFFWMGRTPVNYRPGILPRSQDLEAVIEETTGFYGVSRGALERYRCRIGANPKIVFVDKFEAVDINTEDDFRFAEHVGRVYWNLPPR